MLNPNMASGGQKVTRNVLRQALVKSFASWHGLIPPSMWHNLCSSKATDKRLQTGQHGRVSVPPAKYLLERTVEGSERKVLFE